MGCNIKRNKITNEIESVTANNGNSSILFKNINNLIRDKEKAANVYSVAYTPQFILNNGDWITLERVKRTDPGNESMINELESHITHALDENGEPDISILSDHLPQDTNITSSDTQLKDKINNFLSLIGVNVQTASLPLGVQAQSELLNNTIKVAKGISDISVLGEEAAHFYISLLNRNSDLYKSMMDKITSLPEYKDVLAAYSNNPSYRIDGKPNFIKLKEEAIGKVISSQMKGLDTSAPKSWLERIMSFIRDIFSHQQNPFINAAEDILNSKVEGLSPINQDLENNIMYSLASNTTAEDAYNNIKNISDTIEKKASSRIDPETKKAIDKYYINGKEIDRRVTDLVKSFYNKVFGATSRIDESKREIYNIQAEKGTNIHNDIEHIESRMLNANGTIRDNIANREDNHKPNTNESIYNMLESHIVERFNNIKSRYGKDTRILTEVKIADTTRDIAGTIDLLIIKPNGRVDILDWKSTDFNTKKLSEGLPWWKTEAYGIQLDEYANILKSQYNVDVDLKRAIPIRAVYSKNSSTKKYTELSNIEVGSSIVNNISDNKQYLNPVPSKTEKTNIKELDNLLDKLRSLYQEIKDKKVSIDERYIKNQELEKLKKAINDIQVRQSLDGLVNNGRLLINNVTKQVNENSLTLPVAQTYYKEILLYADITKLMGIMEAQDYGEKLTNDQKQQIYELFGQANTLENTLKNWLLEAASEIANTQGIKGIQDVERSVGFWKGMVRSISNSPNATVQTFYKYLNSFQNDIEIKRDNINEDLEHHRKNLLVWAKSNNIPVDKIFDGMLEIDNRGRWNGSFLNKYTKEYLDAKRTAIEDRDITKLEELLDLSDEAKSRFEKRQSKFMDWVNKTQFSLDSVKDKQIRDRKIDDWNYQYNVFDTKYKSTALLNYNNGILGKENYVTDKWKSLHNSANAPLKATYDYFQNMLNDADRELGMIDNTGKFIPSVENDKLDMWNQYGNASIFNLKGFFESFEYKTNNTFGEIDPLTGKAKKSVPKLFLNNLGIVKKDELSGEEYTDFTMKSKDLFTVFSLYGKHMAEYEYMSKLEEIGSLMLTVEDIKGKHLEKGRDGKYKEIIGNEENLRYLDDFVNYYVYGQKLKDTDAWEFDLFGKTYSGKAAIQGVIRYMGMKTLAFNTTSIAANYVGGKFNTFFVASKGKFLDRSQWAFGEYAFPTDKGKALINYFDIFLEDESYHRSKQLSVYDSVKYLSYDNLFIGQRLTDKAVQYPVLLGMTKAYGVIDNKIVNLKEYVQNKNGYANIYNLTASEQQALLKKIDSEVKALDNISIWNLATIKDNKIEIPGIPRDAKTILDFRQQVRKANKTILGNATGEDISRYRMSLLGQALGQFRNWMPPLIDERFSSLNYNADVDAWNKGKAISLFNNYFNAAPSTQSISRSALDILTKHIGALVKDLIGFTSNTDIQSRAKALYAKEKAKALEQNLPFNITEHQYIDLHITNIKSMLSEIRLIVAFTGLIFSMGAALPPKKKAEETEDEKQNRGMAKYVTRMMDKFNNELMFYYNPINFTQLLQSPIPAIGLAEDVFKFFGHLAGQGYATVTNNEDLAKKYKPTKFILKNVPIAREIYTLGTIFNEDMRQAYGVTR